MTLGEYIDLITFELSTNTSNIFLGKKLKCPISEKEIKDGIMLGLELRSNKKF